MYFANWNFLEIENPHLKVKLGNLDLGLILVLKLIRLECEKRTLKGEKAKSTSNLPTNANNLIATKKKKEINSSSTEDKKGTAAAKSKFWSFENYII